MSSRTDLGPALVEGLGVFLLAFFGSDALFGLQAEGMHGFTMLIPALTISIGVVAYRLEHAAQRP